MLRKTEKLPSPADTLTKSNPMGMAKMPDMDHN